MSQVNLSCQECPIRDKGPLCDLEERYRELFDLQKLVLHLEPGQTLFHQLQPQPGLYIVIKGHLCLYRNDAEGRRQIFRLVGAGSLLGRRSLFEDRLCRYSAEALGHSELCLIEGSLARQAMAESPGLVLRLLKTLAKDLDEAEERIHSLACDSVARRLSALLLTLKRSSLNGRSFRTKLTREDMACYIAATPESVSRAFRQLKDLGLVQARGREITILDEAGLLKVA